MLIGIDSKITKLCNYSNSNRGF